MFPVQGRDANRFSPGPQCLQRSGPDRDGPRLYEPQQRGIFRLVESLVHARFDWQRCCESQTRAPAPRGQAGRLGGEGCRAGLRSAERGSVSRSSRPTDAHRTIPNRGTMQGCCGSQTSQTVTDPRSGKAAQGSRILSREMRSAPILPSPCRRLSAPHECRYRLLAEHRFECFVLPGYRE
jgi:hypothetical protein